MIRISSTLSAPLRRAAILWRQRFGPLLLCLLGLSAAIIACTANPQGDVSSAAIKAGDYDCGSPSGGPTDNPVASRYRDERFAWTDDIQWQCVYNITDFAGATDGERFAAARDAAADREGGVVYLPAGRYQFEADLYLTDGVVVRGEQPEVDSALEDGFAPPTQLEFPRYQPQLTGTGTANSTAFKQILTENPDGDRNLGLVDLDINRAGIALVGDADAGTSQNIILLGLRSNNVAEPDPRVPDLEFQSGWMRYSNRFTANIKVSAAANVLVANCRLNDAITDTYEQPGYIVQPLDGDSPVTYAEGWQVPFDYADHYGIVVNRSKDGGFDYAADGEVEPGLFRPGITIQDNWVYHTMRVGIHAAGQGLVIRGNHIGNRPDKRAWTDPTGLKQPRGSVTFENRAIDWSGWDVTIADNTYAVYRHRIMDTAYSSVDGEGILIQQCCGGTSINGATIRNNSGNAYIGIYKVPDVQAVQITGNRLDAGRQATNLIYVNADTNAGPGSMADVQIRGNQVAGDILAIASSGENNVIAENQGSGTIRHSCHVQVQDNAGFEVEPCED